MKVSCVEEAAARLRLDRGIVGATFADGFVENGGIGSKSRDGHLIDVAAQRAGVEQIARDVVQPEALA